MDSSRVVAVAVALATGACGGQPLQDGAPSGAGFGALTGPTAFAEGNAVCPPPPEPPPDGCTPPTGEPPPATGPMPQPSPYMWMPEGPRLTNASAGFSGVLADTSTSIQQANDPDLVMLPDGSVRMYYNWGDDASGVIYSALYAGAPFAADQAPLRFR